MQLPWNEALLLWRRHRGLTQADLARAAEIPRPNLSAIERGSRDITLRTLRALALALDVRPGILADGVGPGVTPARQLTREQLERIADAVVAERTLANAEEQALADAMSHLVQHRLHVAGRGRGRAGRNRRKTRDAWLWLESSYGRETVNSLLQRITDRLMREPHESASA